MNNGDQLYSNGCIGYLIICLLIVGVIGLFIKFYQTHIQMTESDERPLLLNDSLKDSTDPSAPPAIPEGSVAVSPSLALTQGEELSPYKQKLNKRYKILQVCSIIWIIIAIVIIFALPPLIEMVIVEQAKEQVIMTSKNEGLWAHFPGDTNTIIIRNFTFFYFDNEGDFIFKNQKPIFTEVAGYKIQELEDFLDIQYLDNGNLVKVRDWTRFVEWYQSKPLDDKVSILNMGNLGYWSTLKQARPTLLLQQGLALLFTNLEASLIPTLLGSGINQQFITNSSSLYSSLLSSAGISKDNTEFLWSDPAYGFYDKENVGFWATAAISCHENEQNSFTFSNDAIVLKNYFALTDSQTKIMMEKVYSYVVSLRKLLLQNHYCAQINMSECTGRYLGVAQMADGWVTANTPPVSTISPNDTICDDNITCKGIYPQPYAFAKNIYKMMNPGSDLDLTVPITFPRQSVLNWFNYNNSIQQGLNYNTAQNCLLHIGNLDDLWQMGMKFEQNMDKKMLQPMRVRFGLQTIAQTEVFWYWIRYFTSNFVLQHGGNANLGISNIFTSGFYQQFSLLQDNLQRFLLSKILVKELSTIECHSFFERALDERDNPDLINSLCHQYPDTQSYQFSLKMVDACEHKYGPQWDELVSAGISLVAMENLCDIQGTDNVGGRLHKYKISLDSQYECNVTPNPYCSNFELALLQWHNSSVTLHPPKELPQLESGTSFSKWNKNIKAIQYEHFIQKHFQDKKNMFPRYNLTTLVGFFTFEGWFSTNLLIKWLNQGIIDPYFYQYIRYVCIYITLNGFTTTRTVREFLFGYEDEFLANVKSSYPPFGGDPSAPSIINFNDLNFTKEEATQTLVFKTGKSDYREVYQNYEINGYRYLVNNYTWFDGNKTVWEWQTPWKKNDYFYGTTAKIFAPNQFEANNLSLLIPQVQRYGSNFFYNQTQKIQRYGIDLYLGYLNDRIGVVSPENDIYYQTLPNVFNVTSIYGLPLYITKNHYMNATEWLDKVVIYNEDHSIQYQSVSKWDETFITVEPYTGVSFQSQIYLQNNYLQKQDPLYQYPIDVLLPIFSISRGGNLTEDKFHELYDPLMTAFTVKGAVVYVGIALAVIFIGLLVFATLKRRKIDSIDETRNISQLGISLQQQHHLHTEHYPEVQEDMVKAQQ